MKPPKLSHDERVAMVAASGIASAMPELLADIRHERERWKRPPGAVGTRAKFSDEELEELAGLHGKAKKKRVAELKAKYLGAKC
jgi:hypothetical protein